jgi:hypothetical protein
MSALTRTFAALAIAWAILVPVAAFAASRTPTASSEFEGALAVTVYRIGSLICHQRPERSFYLFGVPLPVCARCTGIYAGAALMAMTMAVRGAGAGRYSRADTTSDGVRANRSDVRRGVVNARRLLFVSALPTVATLVYEWSTAQMPTHWIRAISGLPLGVVVAWIVGTVAPVRREVM